MDDAALWQDLKGQAEGPWPSNVPFPWIIKPMISWKHIQESALDLPGGACTSAFTVKFTGPLHGPANCMVLTKYVPSFIQTVPPDWHASFHAFWKAFNQKKHKTRRH